jgi:hypothetical protein
MKAVTGVHRPRPAAVSQRTAGKSVTARIRRRGITRVHSSPRTTSRSASHRTPIR